MDTLSAKKNYSYSYYSHYNTSYYGNKDGEKDGKRSILRKRSR